MPGLAAWTSLVDVVALAVSLWLGIYIVTRSPKSPVSWLAGCTLWSLGGYFFDSFMHLAARDPLVWWTGWAIFLSAPLWLHLSLLMVPEPPWWRRALVWLAYVLALALLVVEQATGSVFGVWTGKPFEYASAQLPGALYPWASLLLVGSPCLALLNLARARCFRKEASVRVVFARQVDILILSTACSILAGLYLTLSVWLGMDAPLLPGQAILAVALALLGYGVARHNTLIEGRVGGADFAYSLLATTLIVGVYWLVAYVSYLVFDISMSAFILVLILVILSHSLYEWGGTTLERLFYRRRQRRLRTDLRALTREAGEHDLTMYLQAVLNGLCQSLECTWGWIALRSGDDFAVLCAFPATRRHPAHVDLDLAAEDMTGACSAGSVKIEPGVTAVVPLYARGEQLGAVVLGEKAAGRGAYSEAEMDLIDSLADQLASAIDVARQQDQVVAQIESLVSGFRARERELRQELRSVLSAGTDDEMQISGAEMRPLVEDALRHLHDYAYLGEHRLVQLNVVTQALSGQETVVTHLDRGKALGKVLIGILEKLRPPGPRPRELGREWVQYVILYDAYVLGELNRDIMSKLYISESSFNRARRRAVRGVTRALLEMEQAAKTMD